MNYSKRGCMSDDGKQYTHTDGTAWNLVGCPFSLHSCRLCREPETCGFLKCIEGAYVPSDEEREACETMRAGIIRCSLNGTGFEGCKSVIAPCHLLTAKTCPLRVYLAKHHQPDAWEVKP